MFTGIVETKGRVESIRPDGAGARLLVDLGPVSEGVAPGDSVAVGGICLTAEAIRGSRGEFRVTRETLERTALGRLRAGSVVNLERSLRMGDRIGGHLVLGHVDGTARVVRVTTDPSDWQVRFRVAEDLRWALVPKASVAVDGVSLTIVDPGPDEFSVALVEFTLDRTTLRGLREGDIVNVEADVLGRWVDHLLRLDGSERTPGETFPWERLGELGRFGRGRGGGSGRPGS